MIDPSERRILFVHAHPDDESSQTALAMARYASTGGRVTLVTCTLGELGEVVSEGLRHLSAEQDNRLGEHRLGELSQAMGELGVTDFVRLGGDHRYHDSGMRWAEDGSVVPADTVHDDAFSRADLLEAACHLVELLRSRRPQVVATYNPFGGYGHPDHVQAHRVAMYAVQLAAVPGYRPDLGEPWTVSRVFWSEWSESAMRTLVRALRAAGETEGFAELDPDGPMPPMAVPDEFIDVVLKAPEHQAAKLAALRAHASQVDMGDAFWQLMGGDREEAAVENYRLGAGVPVPPGADDLFAGLG